jgi:hypothetical protein
MSIIIYNRTPLGVDGAAVGVATIEGVVRAARAVTFGYLEVRSRRTRKVTFRIGSVLDHLAHEPTIIDFFLEIPPAKPPFFQHIPFPPRTTRSEKRSDILGIAELSRPKHRSHRILVAVLFTTERFGTLFV